MACFTVCLWWTCFILLYGTILAEKSLCMSNFSCVPLSECDLKVTSSVLFPCHNGLNLYCCPNDGVRNSSLTSILSDRVKHFPVECGVISSDDKITGGEVAELGQFPWMVLLGYQQKFVPYTEFLCGGTIITDKYVLTAAHCIGVGMGHELVTVRVGEHDLKTDIDCTVFKGSKICADPYIDIPVGTYFVHPSYDGSTLKNDIALIKVKTPINFTAYVQPICLPFERYLEKRSLEGQRLIISGWGKTEARKIGGSPVLQYASVYVWEQSKCNQVVPPEVRDISDSQLCANGRKEDACKGDSGGPLFNATQDLDGEIRNFQIGIVSFASTKACGIEELPPIYTRVDKYLKWIVDTISSQGNNGD